MRKRENEKSKLESNKLIFFQLGLIIALLSVLYAFEYKSYEAYELPEFNISGMEPDVDMVDRTVHKKKLPPPPQQTIKIKVDLSNEIDDEPIEIDATAKQETPIDWEPKEEPEQRIVEVERFVPIPEVMPSFPGGHAAMNKFISDNIEYPDLARSVGITGKVYIEFAVEKNGSLTILKVLKEIGGGCDEEAIRIVEIMPPWIPGMQNGRPVRVKLTIPFKFSLL